MRMSAKGHPPLAPREAYALWADTYPPRAHTALMHVEERAMLSRLPADLRGRRMLDVGCGSGRYVRLALQRGASQAIGLDLTAAMLTRLRDLQPGDGDEPSGLVQGRAEALPFRAGVFDVVISALTLGHVEDLAATLGELSRVTREGGRVLVSDLHPLGESLGWERSFVVGDTRYVVRHVTHRIADWRRACRHAGLELIGLLEPVLEPDDVPPPAPAETLPVGTPVAMIIDARRGA